MIMKIFLYKDMLFSVNKKNDFCEFKINFNIKNVCIIIN